MPMFPKHPSSLYPAFAPNAAGSTDTDRANLRPDERSLAIVALSC